MDPDLIDKFIDKENISSSHEISEQKHLLEAFTKPSKYRTAYDLDTLYRFHIQYKFFAEMQKQHGTQSVIETMKLIKIRFVDDQKVLFD